MAIVSAAHLNCNLPKYDVKNMVKALRKCRKETFIREVVCGTYTWSRFQTMRNSQKKQNVRVLTGSFFGIPARIDTKMERGAWQFIDNKGRVVTQGIIRPPFIE